MEARFLDACGRSGEARDVIEAGRRAAPDLAGPSVRRVRRPAVPGRCGAVAVFVLLSGCGINALRTEYASSVASRGPVVAAASVDFLHRVEIARREANIEMVAADPACGTSPAMVRQPARLDRSGPGWLCVGRHGAPGPADRAFTLRPVSGEIEPTILLVGALSSYTEGLADAVDSKPSDPTKPLADALTTAQSAQGFLLALTGGSKGPVPAADDARVNAVEVLVAFLGELDAEAGHVRAVRKVLAAHPEGAAPTIAALKDQLSTWELSRKGDQALRLAVIGSLLRRTLDAEPPGEPDARREALGSFYDAQDAISAEAGIFPALDKALDELGAADADLRRVIVDHPNLNAKERARIAELNRQRAVKALDLLTALITSFKGA